MKAIRRTFSNGTEKELFIKILLLSTIAVGPFSSVNYKNVRDHYVQINNVSSAADSLEGFDKVAIPNKTTVIAKMISVLRPEFSVKKRFDVAAKIHKALKKYNVEPQIVVAIIDAESDFNHDTISSTGDLSLAQINVDIWNKEFERMKMMPIESERMKADEAYSLEVMAQILHILKTRYQKKDHRWYARYHSKTQKHKKAYLDKLTARLKLIKESQVALR
jgi:hypothetical protein